MNNNYSPSDVYQIYYKTQRVKPSTKQLLAFGKSIKMPVKYSAVNKLMRNGEDYLNSLITDDVLQNVIIPQQQEDRIKTMSIKVEHGDHHYFIKDLTSNSKIEDICDKLAPRLIEQSIKINLYKDNTLLSRDQTMHQLDLKDGDSVSLAMHNTAIGIDSFQTNQQTNSSMDDSADSNDDISNDDISDDSDADDDVADDDDDKSEDIEQEPVDMNNEPEQQQQAPNNMDGIGNDNIRNQENTEHEMVENEDNIFMDSLIAMGYKMEDILNAINIVADKTNIEDIIDQIEKQSQI